MICLGQAQETTVHCFFIELANNPARHSFGEVESSSKEAALFGILQAIIDVTYRETEYAESS